MLLLIVGRLLKVRQPLRPDDREETEQSEIGGKVTGAIGWGSYSGRTPI